MPKPLRERKRRIAAAVGSALLASGLASPVGAVVVVGGDNGWEVSFDGSVNGFYVNQNTSALRAVALPNGRILTPSGTGVLSGSSSKDTSRVMSGLLPSFFSFNARSPTVNGLTGSARISFAPSIQNANVKNTAAGTVNPAIGAPLGTSSTRFDVQGSTVDVREVFFNVDGGFGTLSVGRALSLYQRQNYLKSMTTYGVGVAAAPGNGGISMGSIGYGYLYPNYEARISYKTPDVHGIQVEVGMFDPSTVGPFTKTPDPRLEAEATFATPFKGGSFNLWGGGLYQSAVAALGVLDPISGAATRGSVDVWGSHGGAQLQYQGFELMGSAYYGKGLGSNLMMSSYNPSLGTVYSGGLGLDWTGNLKQARLDYGFVAQGSYTFQGRTKVGVMYGETLQRETAQDQWCRYAGTLSSGAAGCGALTNVGTIQAQRAWTVGVYHDVTSWFKVVGEYTLPEDIYHGNIRQTSNVFAIGGHFYW